MKEHPTPHSNDLFINAVEAVFGLDMHIIFISNCSVQFFLHLLYTEPMCRFLDIAEEVLLHRKGVQNGQYINSAITLGDRLYVTERTHNELLASKLFVYDIDDTKLRGENYQPGKLTFSNRRQLLVNGLSDNAWLVRP